MSDFTTSGPLKAGLFLTVLGLGGFLLWATQVTVDGAVTAGGHITTDLRAQAVQHGDGGLIAKIHVREGATVAAGDPILTLEGSELLAKAKLLERALAETQARNDRLQAEASGATTFNFAPDLATAAGLDPVLQTILFDELALFEARQSTLGQHNAQLAERARQSEAMIAGLSQQRDALVRQRNLVTADLSRQTDLYDKGLSEVAAVSQLAQALAGIDGSLGGIDAQMAEARSAISGYDLERLTRLATFQEAAHAEVQALQAERASLQAERLLVAGRLDRLVLRAPMAGTVLDLQTETVGGVIAAGAEVATIIPTGGPQIATVMIDPSQIDRVSLGQSALVRFPAMGAMRTPEIAGTVQLVSADALVDPVTGRKAFTVEIALATTADLKPQSGQPVAAFLHTESRTPASFLLKPATDYWAYAMRER
jgi:HlyD family type I secretion membrane fusion protein